MIGDYWDEQTVAKIVGLLYEYVDLFPHSFGEMKGMVSSIGEMKIELKPGTRPIKKRPYRMNPHYKE